MARRSLRWRRCSSCGSASAPNRRSRWSRACCSSSSISARSPACALDAKLVQMAQVMGASEQQVARKIIFPGAVPNIFAGFRIGLPYAIGAAVIAELISSNRGLGYLVQVGAMNFDTTQCFVAILAATLIIYAVNWIVDSTERMLLHWRPSAEAIAQAGGN